MNVQVFLCTMIFYREILIFVIQNFFKMSLNEQLMTAMKAAMKSKDHCRINSFEIYQICCTSSTD